jgi:hypothetical protein
MKFRRHIAAPRPTGRNRRACCPKTAAPTTEAPPGYITIASIPGLARLIPDTHDPHSVIESPYGRWKLPIRYHGRDVALYRDGTLLARG